MKWGRKTLNHNFLYEKKIQTIRLDPDLSREEKSLQITLLEGERDQKIADDFIGIEARVEEMRESTMENHRITKKLIEAVYNYLSTTPIQVDNIDFWIKKLEEVSSRNTD